MLTVTTMMVDSVANALQDFSATVKTVPTATNAPRELTIVTPTPPVLTSKVDFHALATLGLTEMENLAPTSTNVFS